MGRSRARSPVLLASPCTTPPSACSHGWPTSFSSGLTLTHGKKENDHMDTAALFSRTGYGLRAVLGEPAGVCGWPVCARGRRTLWRVPTGVSASAKEVFTIPRSWAERDFNTVAWNEQPSGGHFPAHERLELCADKIPIFRAHWRV